MFFIAGFSIGVFIAILLISKKNKSESDKILTLWIVIMTVHLFSFYLVFTKEIFNYPFLLGVNFPFPLLHGVFLYFYVGSVTDQLPKNKKVLLLHFLPFAVSYLYLTTYFRLPAEEKINIFKNEGAGYEPYLLISNVITALSGIIYVIWSTALLRKHKRRILNHFSDLEKINLQWLQMLTIGMGGIWLLVIFAPSDAWTFGGAVLFVFLIGFFGIRQVGIFTFENSIPEEEEKKSKYSKSGLTAELSEKIYKELIRFMEGKFIYRKNDLNISELASWLDVHPNYLSQIINEREGKNFYDFVNNYRIEEFKRRAVDPQYQHFTLLSLAYDCGFNSKSSFNRHFKKLTGRTPSQYVKEVSQNKD